MHGCLSGFLILVDAEVDSMGGDADSGDGIDSKTSPRLAAIEKVEAELRQEYDVREERRRQIDFLAKGCDPLEFTIGNAASISVQSTSLTDQHPEQFVISEAKGSSALIASPPGDSVESSGIHGAPPVCDPNSADNLRLFDGVPKGEKTSIHPSRNSIVHSKNSSQYYVSQYANESGDSASFGFPKKAYRRRFSSRSKRDGNRSSSMNVVHSRIVHASLPCRHAPGDGKGLTRDADNQKVWNASSNYNLKPTSPNCTMAPKAELFNSCLYLELDGAQALESTMGLTKGDLSDAKTDANTSSNLLDTQHNQFLESDARVTPIDLASEKPEYFGGRELVALAGQECLSSLATVEVENQITSGQLNGFSCVNGDRKKTPNEGQNSSAVISTKGLNSESSCTQTSLSLDRNNDSEICTNIRNDGCNENIKEEAVTYEEAPNMEGGESVKVNTLPKADDICAANNDDVNLLYKSHFENDSILKGVEALNESVSGLQNQMKNPIAIEGTKPDSSTASEKEIKPSNLLGSNSTHELENSCTGRHQGLMDSSIREIPETALSVRVSTVAPEQQTCSLINLKSVTKVHDDSVLEEARIIEAKRERIAELSARTLCLRNHQKSHWDFVLEEMAWLASDFAQERLWKITATAQIGRQAAASSRLKFQEKISHWKRKEVAHNMAKYVMEFWHFVEQTSSEKELQNPVKDFAFAVQGYALRFLKYNQSCALYSQEEAPVTPDRISDLGILDMSWKDHLTEENLFYTVPAGGMEAYRKSIESHLQQCEKTGSTMQEGVETSGFDTVAEFGSQENAFEVEEGETSAYYLPGAFDRRRSSKFSQKKRKNLIKTNVSRSYEMGYNSSFMQCIENKVGNHQSVLNGKRPTNSVNVSIPTKRLRTASRVRVISPYNVGTSGCVQEPSKTDASSGDTNSFQDEQSTLQGDFEKQFPFDSMEVSQKPKKKAKNLGSTYEQRWQMNSSFQNDQRNHSKRRLEIHQLESNGSGGLFGQHVMKKPKIMKQSLESSIDNLTSMAGSIHSLVASRMSNMSSPNKFIKMLGGRDRGRKSKELKTATGQTDSGSPWSLFEDQALVVLVHDMGPNWGLISDAINSILQFKYIIHKPNECKERHKCLMDSPDGADSAEDSGSSQTYRSTLPGIPKGSARQLFQRLQGPLEEDTIKSHLEKIIVIGKKQHHKKPQYDSQEQLQLPHSSHTLALSQVCPSNLNGGRVLMPLDLLDASASSPEVLSLGYQNPHTGGLSISNQGTVAQIHHASGFNSSVQPSANVVLGSNFSSPSGPLNASIRDSRYGIPRTASLSIEEQQRLQQYNQMLSCRNIQQPVLSVPGVIPGTERGLRMINGGDGVGIVCELSRSMPMAARPGLQGITSTAMINSDSLLSSGMVAIPNPVSMLSGSGPGPGQVNSMLRSRDALHMMLPAQNSEQQRHVMVPELQMQVSQGSSQGTSPFGGLSSPFSNQSAPAPVQSYPFHHQPHSVPGQQSHVLSNSHHPHLQGPNHATNTQHQAYTIRLAKERRIQQQQQQFSGASALMSHVPVQSHLPISSPQNNLQLHSQTSCPPLSLLPLSASSSITPMSQNQQKHLMPAHGVIQNPQAGGSGSTNQMGKPRRQPQQQQQQFQQAGRNHPQQRQQSQSQQQVKILKGAGRANMTVHQNLPMDHALNGVSANGSQPPEKEEQVMHMLQGQGSYSGSVSRPVQPSKQLPSHYSHPQQKIHSGQATPSSKQLPQIPSHSDDSNQNHVPPVGSSPTLSNSLQAVPPPNMTSNQQQQQQSQARPQPHLRLVTKTQPTVQRVLQQNHQAISHAPSKLLAIEAESDQHPVNNSSHMGTTTVPRGCIDVTVIPAVSSASAPHWKPLEPLYDSGTLNHMMQFGSVGTPPLTNSASEPSPPVNQGLGQRQSSGNLPPVGHDVGVQWSQKPSQLQPPTSPPLFQQQDSLQQQQPPQQQYQQQTQLLQGESSSLYGRPPNSRPE